MLIAILLLLVVLVPFNIVSAAEPQDNYQVAPPNPAFLDYLRAKPLLFSGSAPIGFSNLGYVPTSFDLSHVDSLPEVSTQELTALPGIWDWRTQGKLTPVKNQGNAGTCWAFATLGSLESRIKIIDDQTFDLSEQNLITGVDPAFVSFHSDRRNAGGNFLMSTDMLSKNGTRLESSQPYNPDTLNTEVYFDGTPVLQKVNNFRVITSAGTNPANYTKIKTAISTYGPLMAAYYVDDAHFYPATNTYYYPNCPYTPNHAVCLVGWDDTKAHPAGGGHGAWIVKNSWGTGFGEEGYFYLCYGSATLSNICGYYGANAAGYEEYIPGEKIYFWDEAGLRSAIGANTSSSWMRSVFTASKAGSLTNVEFWTTSPSAQYQIQVRNSSDALQYTQSGTCVEQGFYSIPLGNPVSLSAGQEFKVDVYMTTPGFNFPIPVETITPGYCEPEIQANVSFVKTSSGGPWIDTASILGGYNVCLRAVEQDPVALVLKTDPQTLTAGQVSSQIEVEVQNSVTHDPVPVGRNTILNLSSSSNTGKFDISSTGLFNGAVTSVIILNGGSNASFYYKDITAGTPTITVSTSGITGCTQTESINPGPPSRIRVETEADGTGTTVAARNLVAGNTLTVFGVTRDSLNNYTGNPAETTWSLIKTGGVVDTDLSAASGASVTLTANLAGSAIIHPANGDLDPTDSGTITITKGAFDHLQIQTQPASTLSVDSAFSTAAVVKACDAGGNPISGISIAAARDPDTGSGALRGTLTVATDASGSATFSNLAYNKPDVFKVKFSSGTRTIISNPIGPLAAGAVKAISMASPPAAGASVDLPLGPQPVIAVKDQFDNPIEGIEVAASIATGTPAALRGTTTATSAPGTGLAAFTNLGYNKSGQPFSLRFTTGSLAITSGSLGPLAAGAPAQIRVETAANGSGSLVGIRTLLSGNTLTVFGIARDQYANFAGNPAENAWSLVDIKGHVVGGDLSPLSGSSATLTAHLAGSAVIHVENGALTPVDSGTITVNMGPPAAVSIATPPAGSSVDVPLVTQPVVLVTDTGGNPVGGVSVTAVKATGSGALRGTLNAVSDIDGLAAFSDLGYSKAGEAFTLRFTAGSLSVASNPLTLEPGSATQIKIETAADGKGKVVASSSLRIGASLTVYGISRDQFNNFVDNPSATVWSLTGKTGGIVDGDLVASGDGKSAVLTGHLKGTAIIQAAKDSLTPGISGTIKVGYTTSSGGGGGGGGSTLTRVNLSGLNSSAMIYVSTSGIVSAVSQVTTADGVFTLNIPAGTKMLTKENSALTSLSAEVLAATPATPSGSALVLAYNLGPEGATFTPALTLTLSYDPAKLPKNVLEKDLYIAWYDGTQFQGLASTVDEQANKVTSQMAHLSSYALLGKITLPPSPAPSPASDPSPAPKITPAPEPKPQPASSPAVTFTPTTPAAPTAPPIDTAAPQSTPASSPENSPAAAGGWPMITGIIVGLAIILAVSILVIKRRKP